MTGMEIAAYAAVALAAVGTVSAISQGQQQSAMNKYNADMAARSAQIAQQQAAAAADQQRRTNLLRQGAAAAAWGSSGTTMEGSPLDVMEQNAAQQELDVKNILYKGQLGAYSSGAQASAYASAADNAMTGGYMKAGSSLLMGGVNAGTAFSRIPTPPGTAPAATSDYGPYQDPWLTTQSGAAAGGGF